MLRKTNPAITAAIVFLLACVDCGGAPSPTGPSPEPALEPAPAKESSPPEVKRKPIEVRFKSAALGVEKNLVVSLPGDYETSDRRYPVLYMLHGLGGNETNWLSHGIELAATEAGLEAIIVMPDGDDGFYVNWKTEVDYKACMAGKRPFGREKSMATYCVRKAQYGDYISRDVIEYIDANYRTIAAKSARAIGGLSMGGYGALLTAFRNPDLFAAVASHAGVASLRYAGPFPFAAGKSEQFDDPSVVIKGAGAFGAHFALIYGDKLEAWKAADPVTHALSLADGQLAIYLDAGTKDEFRLQNGTAHLAETLTAAGIANQFHLIEGGRHNDEFWRSRVAHSMRFFAEALNRPEPSGSR